VRDYLPPLFQLGAGIGFFLFLIVNLMTRAALRDLPSKLFGGAMVLIPVGFVLVSQGVDESSLGAAAPMLISAGSVFLLASVLVGIGLIKAARNVTAAGTP
jgi:hypothetical protein